MPRDPRGGHASGSARGYAAGVRGRRAGHTSVNTGPLFVMQQRHVKYFTARRTWVDAGTHWPHDRLRTDFGDEHVDER
jgi:hypothetical protein